jgi:SMODS and SLOG-associating 2TM effector domain 1/SMODS and SLOG-associating 2TM effector domain 3
MEAANYPALFSSSDAASLKAQRTFGRLLGTQLLIFVLASGLGVIAAGLGRKSGDWLALTTAVLLIAGVLLMWLLRAERPEKVWFDCRAVAESVKTATWRYMMQVPPFGAELDQASTDTKFVEELAAIRTDRPGVEKYLAGLATGPTEITDFMVRARALCLRERHDLYIRDRLQDQKVWYETKAATNRGTADRWLKAIIALQLAALGLAILHLLFASLYISPVPVLMTLASSLLAWTQAKRHEDLTEPYALAAQELRELESLAKDVNDPQTFEKYVADVEETISREHTMWRARRSMPLSLKSRGANRT